MKLHPALNVLKLLIRASKLKTHWHWHLSVWGLILAGFLLTAGAGAAIIARGGFRWSAPPPPIRVEGGRLPRAWYLGRYVTRIHNQGSSSSCVAQTLSTIEEITQAERKHRLHFSAGYIYDQINGGRDAGSTYDAAYGVLIAQGDSRLRIFPHDGEDWWVQPGRRARSSASRYRFLQYRSISPSDRHTMEAEIRAGRPIALAIPVRDTFYDHWNDSSPIVYDTGAYHFDHSITAVGYNRTGLRVLNSWGPAWGYRGRATLTWQFVASNTVEMVISVPR